jgi:hypothetical protein
MAQSAIGDCLELSAFIHSSISSEHSLGRGFSVAIESVSLLEHRPKSCHLWLRNAQMFERTLGRHVENDSIHLETIDVLTNDLRISLACKCRDLDFVAEDAPQLSITLRYRQVTEGHSKDVGHYWVASAASARRINSLNTSKRTWVPSL